MGAPIVVDHFVINIAERSFADRMDHKVVTIAG
jgi:hypothetical protein